MVVGEEDNIVLGSSKARIALLVSWVGVRIASGSAFIAKFCEVSRLDGLDAMEMVASSEFESGRDLMLLTGDV